MSAIYLHIPFCKRLCGYCDFFKSVKLQDLDRTLDAMECELVEQKGFLRDNNIKTIYFGGGTPSLVAPERLARLLDIIAQNYCVDNLEEVTVEVNPDDLSLSYLESLKNIGVNRLSVGIQSFDDEELRFMNRRHSAAQAIEAVKIAQSVGFDNITIDLIFGVDGFGEDVLRRSIATALSLKVQHISAYHLTIEGGTPFARRVAKGEFSAVDELISQQEYNILEQELVAAGYEHYEVSNYALPNYRSRHNSSYWHGVEYLGIGAGAHSFNGAQRRYANNSIAAYLSGGDDRYECEELTVEDHYNECVMTSLRCCEGVKLDDVSTNFGGKFYNYLMTEAKPWLREGKLVEAEGRLYIPTQYFMLSDAIIESFFWCES